MKIEGNTDFGRVTVELHPTTTPFQLMLIGAVTALLQEVEGDESSIRIDGKAMEVRDSVNLHSFEMLWQDILDFRPKTHTESAAVGAASPFIEEMLEGFRDGQEAARDSARSASTRPDNIRPRRAPEGALGGDLEQVKIGGVRKLVDSLVPPRMSEAALYAESLRISEAAADDDQPNEPTESGTEERQEAPQEARQKPAKREGVRRLGEPRPEPPEPPARVKRFPGQALQRTRVKGAIRRLSR